MHYLGWGNQHNPPLVLLHGIHGHAHTWDSFAYDMREDYHVLAPDMRGHGDSQWAEDGAYQGENYLADLSAFVQELSLPPFTLVGESLGGIVAFAFAAMNPGAVDRLVIVDIGPEIAADGLGSIRQSAQTRPSDFADLEEAVRWVRGDEPLAVESEVEVRRRIQHNLTPTSEGRLRWKYDPSIDTIIQPGDSRSDGLLWQLWSAIPCPTLIVRGENSDLLTTDTAGKMVSRAANATLVTIPNASHAVLVDNPQAFIEAATAFLAST